MTEHVVAAPVDPIDDHTHAGVGDPNAHHSPEEIRKEMRVYLIVFGALGLLTVVTVGICYLPHALAGYDMPVHYAIMVALAVAIVKGSLVACFFMHLISEKKLIYSVLVLTVFFFIVLVSLPVLHYLDKLHY